MAMKVYVTKKQDRSSRLVRFLVLPVGIIALVATLSGIYSFSVANKLMREKSLSLKDFPSNILPSFQNASFQSIDGQTSLSGWFFASKQKPVSTVIIVHSAKHNRLQFGDKTSKLYNMLLNKRYNVFSFDLRNSGDSSGNISSFGYTEWQDVIAAIEYVRKVSVTKDVVLYGIGTGATACTMALERLPENKDNLENVAYNIKVLNLYRSYVSAMILQGASANGDYEINAMFENSRFPNNLLGKGIIPYMVRMSAGNEDLFKLADTLTRNSLPIQFILGTNSSKIISNSEILLSEARMNMFPYTTSISQINSQYASQNYDLLSDELLNAIDSFLSNLPGSKSNE